MLVSIITTALGIITLIVGFDNMRTLREMQSAGMDSTGEWVAIVAIIAFGAMATLSGIALLLSGGF